LVAQFSNMDTRKKLFGTILGFSGTGLLASVYSVKTHYEGGDHAICSFNEVFNCDVVNHSAYSEFFGIPVALIGIAGYVFIMASIMQYKTSKNTLLMNLISLAVILGAVFSAYLTYIEAYVLYTWCIICITSAISMFVVMSASLWLRQIDEKNNTA